MSETMPARSPRIAAAFLVVGLLLSTAGVLYIMWAGREQELTPEPPINNRQIVQINAMLDALYITLLLVGTFVIGSYVMTRIGRSMLRKREARGVQKTEYVDAWSQYRLSDQQISDATGGPPPDPAGDT